MKKLIFVIALFNLAALMTAPPARAVMIQYGTTNRTIAVTNNLPATEVRPLAAYFLFQTPATGSVTISRVTQGVAVPLARHDFSSAAALTWFPPADYPVRRGEAFAVSSTVARFTLQLETSADGNPVHRTDAVEWYDQGTPFTAQVQSGGGSTQVIVTNYAQLFVTNNSFMVVSNAWQLHFTNNVVVTNSFFVTNTAQIVVSNSPTFHLTNNIVLTNSIVVTNLAQITVSNSPQFNLTNSVSLTNLIFVTNTAQIVVSNSPQFHLTNNVVLTNVVVVTNTTHVVVTNSTLVVVTNAPQIVITNIVNVSTGGNGGGGSFIPSDAPFVTTNGTQNFWDDGGSLNYGNINGVWFSFMSPSQIGLRGESGNTYYMGFQDDFGTPQLIFHDPTTGTKTLADLAAAGSALPAPWTASADGAGLHIASDNPSAGSLQIGGQYYGTILSSDTHSLSLWGDNNPMQIDGVTVAFTGANENDVWTYSASGGWHAAAPSGGSMSGGLPDGWGFSQPDGNTIMLTNDSSQTTGSLLLSKDGAMSGIQLNSGTHSITLGGGGEPIWIDGTFASFTGANENDVWTYSASAGWHPSAPSGGSGSGDNLGNGLATNNVDLQTYALTASSDAGGYRIAQTIQIHGFQGGDSDGGSIDITAGGGHGYQPGSITITAGGDVSGMHTEAGNVSIIGGNAQADSSGVGGNVTIQAGPGGNGAGEIALVSGPTSNGGRGGIRLDFSGGGDLKVQTDAMPTIYTGTTEDVTVGDGSGGTLVLHFVRGIYIGHTAP